MDLSTYFSTIDLDIRKHRVGTFIDQKVTLDVLCAVAECICVHLETNVEPFSKNDIINSKFAKEMVVDVFHKPDIKNAVSEYDKFFGQPIKFLSYAGVLTENKDGKEFVYKVKQKEILEFISIRERNALLFLQSFCSKLLQDSGIYHHFEYFFQEQTKNSFKSLKNSFIDFIIEHTPKNKKDEPSRIFTKILNPLSYKFKKLGTRKGFISNTPITLDELYYNRLNWRDIGKDKSLTRKEAKELSLLDENVKSLNYFSNKAKKYVKSLHVTSEVHRYDPTPATQAHHIFMASEFPELSHLPENIICLTPNQHFHLAHPNNNTTIIDPHYQLVCLISKLDSIEQDIREQKESYSYKDFIYVLNTGFGTDIFSEATTYETLKHQIIFNKLKTSYV